MEVQKKITTSDKWRSHGYNNISVLGFDDDGEEIVLVSWAGRATNQKYGQMQKNDICRHHEINNNMKQRLRNKLAQKRATQ
jgi:hypothetical protein